ncbi:transcription factor FAMA-like [Salvia divinorum]|uniref:Transcription factor FAMA-like n=1 Tax=Salvia divinorum TaxID=28513 RepID=A0ABD1I188_SALDI
MMEFEGEKASSPAVENLEAKGKSRNKRKRAKAGKTSEEVERQRMTHIEVERNRRKQMNEHLQMLRSLMPAYYVHRGDQASIVGAAIEYVRELQQLLQCLESVHHQQQPRLLVLPPTLDHHDQTAESKSCLAEVEVRLSGLLGTIKILSGRRRGQITKNISAVEYLHLQILQTHITTTEQHVVCSFSVKMSREAMLTAADVASSIQQILNCMP